MYLLTYHDHKISFKCLTILVTCCRCQVVAEKSANQTVYQFQGRCANLYSVMSAVRFHPNSVNKCLKRNAFLLRGKFVSLFPNKSVRLCQGSNVLMYQDKNALLYLAKNVALCPDSNVNKYQDNSVLMSQENSAVEVQDKSAHRFLDKTASRCLRSSAPVCQEARS